MKLVDKVMKDAWNEYKELNKALRTYLESMGVEECVIRGYFSWDKKMKSFKRVMGSTEENNIIKSELERLFESEIIDVPQYNRLWDMLQSSDKEMRSLGIHTIDKLRSKRIRRIK